MSSDEPKILPKGIVVNAPGLENAIKARGYGPLTSDEIRHFWRVYTVTTRKLHDPTAQRLEHFWWRIWGSQWRPLNATTVADIMTHISHGPTFVPLPGPPNRDEGGSNPLIFARHGPGCSSDTTVIPSRSSTATSSSTSKVPASSPLPPILKKSRAPPATGPRPTVGFASPSNSGDEEDSASVNEVEPSGESAPEPQSATPDKKGGRRAGGFVASSKKKRPLMPRRKSSQDAETAKRTASSLSPPAPVEQSSKSKGKGKVVSKFQDQLSPLSALGPQPSKSKGKGKAVAGSKFIEQFSPSPEKTMRSIPEPSAENKRKSTSETANHSEEALSNGNSGSYENPVNGKPGPSSLRNLPRKVTSAAPPEDSMSNEEIMLQRTALGNFQKIHKQNGDSGPSTSMATVGEDLTAEELEEELKMQETLVKEFEKKNQARKKKERKNGSQPELGEGVGVGKYQGVERKSSASLAHSTTAASGQLALGGDATGPSSSSLDASNDKVFARRPVMGGSAASVPSVSTLERSKSQLALLLEKNRGKDGGGSGSRRK